MSMLMLDAGRISVTTKTGFLLLSFYRNYEYNLVVISSYHDVTE